jgi:hypothetical protein
MTGSEGKSNDRKYITFPLKSIKLLFQIATNLVLKNVLRYSASAGFFSLKKKKFRVQRIPQKLLRLMSLAQ